MVRKSTTKPNPKSCVDIRDAVCPVSALARDAQSLIDRFNAADGAEGEAHKKRKDAEQRCAEEDRRNALASEWKAERQKDQFLDFLDGINSRATYLRTDSARGALFQLALIRDKIDSLSALVTDEFERTKRKSA